ncbi:MAG: AraC family ligand binding domain-containing protein, partial [Clostridia bacterium]|nr:AraC family ligand binding domain-containing protein [Clostridia bacterium]
MERNESNHNTYEVHALNDVPVIFHHDKARSRSRYANWHENVEILYFTSGTGTVLCGDKCIPVAAGDISVIDSGLLHRIESGSEVLYHCLIVDEAFCRNNGLHPGAMTFPRVIKDTALAELYNNVAKAFEATGQDKKVFGVVGDSTFFHSGMTGAAEIIYNKSRVIPVVLDNSITGMTGHQDNPGSGMTLQGEIAESIKIEN